MGSVTNEFGTPGVAANCLRLDFRADTDRFRNKLLNHCLRVSRAMSSAAARDARVRIAVVGGGAIGVELAAEPYNSTGGLRLYGLEVFDEFRLEVTLVEVGSRILPALPDRLTRAAQDGLVRLGVRVLDNTRVTSVDDHAIVTAQGESI